LGQASGNNVGTQRQKLPQMLPLLLHLFHRAARHPAPTTHFMFFFFCPLSAVLAFGSASLMQIRSAAQLSPRMQNNKTVKSRQEQAATAKGTMAEREGHSGEEREGTNNT